MRQQGLLTTVAGETELLHHLVLFCVGHGGAVKVGALAVGITLELLEAALVVEPLVSQELSAIHTTDRNNHRTLPWGLKTVCQV